MQVLENEQVRVAVQPVGAELCSLMDKDAGIEHIWQADPQIWGRHAPILFPIVGRLNNGAAVFNGKEHSMARHGFFRDSLTSLVDASNTHLLYELRASEETKQVYPYDFSLQVGYHLHGKQLLNSFQVINTGTQTLPFNLGGHPAFAIRHFDNETIEDYYLQFEHEEYASRHLLSATGLYTGATELVFDQSALLPISESLFKKDALVFKDLQSKSVQLKSHKHRHGLTFRFEQWPYLGIWAKPGAPFVCIEPWMGCADTVGFTGAFEQKEQVVLLEPGERKELSFAVEVF